MAAKFSMANTSGLFDTGAHLEATDRMQTAMEELKIKNDQQKQQAAKAKEQKIKQIQQQQRLEKTAAAKIVDDSFIRTKHEEEAEDAEEDVDSDDELLNELDEDPELARLREIRLKQIKSAYEMKQQLLAKGHGEYREIVQDEFLKEVTSSALVAVHFYHRDFERCKIMDMHLARLAKRHVECKFVKINAEKAPFFVEKLVIRVLPTVVCFKDGIAFPTRVLGFEGLTASDEAEEQAAFGSRGTHHVTSSDTFPTIALARKLVEIGVIHDNDADEEDE